MKNKDKPARRTILCSFRDAFRGVWDCLRSERNMRVHSAACLYVLFFASRLPLTRGEMACLFLCLGLVTSAETLNTAVEKLCDFEEKHLNPRIRLVKDLAAGAVLLCALAAAMAGVVILIRPELWEVFRDILRSPGQTACFGLSIAAALCFIILGPDKIAGFFQKGRRG